MRYMLSVAIGIVFCLSPLAVAQEKLGTRVRDAIETLGADEATVVVRVNAEKIDIPAIVKWIEEYPKVKLSDIDSAEKSLSEVSKFLQTFREAGAKEVIVLLYSTPASMGLPIDMAAAIPIADGKSAAFVEKMRDLLNLPPQFELRANGGYAFVATKERHAARGQAESALKSPVIPTAFDSLEDDAIQIGLFLPDDMRRAVRETIPKLPAEYGGISGQQIADWTQWSTLSINLPPKISLKLQVQGKDVAAADHLAKVIQQLIDRVAAERELLVAIPDLQKILLLFKPVVKDDRVVVSVGEKMGDVESIAKLLVTPLRLAREEAERARNMNSLKQIGLAMHNYLDSNKTFPGAASLSKDGKPLLSWRVHVLPYLDEAALYKEFKLDEPWDSEHNRKLIDKMPKVYENARAKIKDAGRTNIVVPISEHSIFGGKEPMRIQSITDGTSNTILALETDAAHAVIWTKPEDLKIDDEKPTTGFLFDSKNRFLVLFADGSVQSITNDLETATIRALITADGGEVVDLR